MWEIQPGKGWRGRNPVLGCPWAGAAGLGTPIQALFLHRQQWSTRATGSFSLPTHQPLTLGEWAVLYLPHLKSEICYK